MTKFQLNELSIGDIHLSKLQYKKEEQFPIPSKQVQLKSKEELEEEILFYSAPSALRKMSAQEMQQFAANPINIPEVK
jgi:hypothetical protein